MANQPKGTKKPRAGTKADLEKKLNATSRQLDHAIQLNSYLSRLSRAGLGRALGQSFDGDRKLYETLGYKLDPEYSDYLNIYERDGIGTRVVDLVSDETWRKHPILFESEEKAEDEKAEPGPIQERFKELVKSHDLWAQFLEADRMLGISRFSLLYLGLPGRPEDEIKGKAGQLAYVITCDEGNATVDETSIVKDPESNRFGLPEYYQIVIDDQGELSRRVHYSRVIHIKQGRQRGGGLGRVYGVPGLKNIINRFWDLEKVVGGGSEAYWKLIYQGVVLKAMEGFTLPSKDSDEYEAMQDEWDEWEHNLRRVIRARGLDVQELGGHPVDSREQFDVIIEYISGSKGIPQRRLLGSERGELASSQDDDNFSDLIDARRRNFAEPYILRPFLDRCDELGILDLPEEYFVDWPSLIELNDMQKADLAVKTAQAMSTASGGAPETIMPPEEFAKRYLNFVWTPAMKREQADKEEKAMGQGNKFPPPQAGDGNGSGGFAPNPEEFDLGQMKEVLKTHGGPGSGHKGHKGRPGRRGGFAPGKGAGARSNIEKAVKTKIREAAKAEPEVTSTLQRIADKAGGRLVGLDNKLKTAASLSRKIRIDSEQMGITPEEAALQINDSLRYTLVFNPETFVEDVKEVQTDLARDGWKKYDHKWKNFFKPGGEYAGYNTVMVNEKTGFRFEIQYHTEDSLTIKRNVHKIYEIWRELDANDAKRLELAREMSSMWNDLERPVNWQALPGVVK